MGTVDQGTAWWRCAYFAYLDSEQALDRMDEDEARRTAVRSLQDTVEGFLGGRWNFGTLKYRMDGASAESGLVFPPRSVTSTLSDLALGVPLDDLEPALRRAAALPDDPGAAKGSLMDLEEAMERAVSGGSLERSKARPERWPELAACLWHIQDPLSWPLANRQAMVFLRSRGEVSDLDPSHDYAEYAAAMLRLSETTGGSMTELEHLLEVLDEGALPVPDPASCLEANLRRAEECASQGRTDEALTRYERALALDPRLPHALRRKAELYESKGLIMAAIGELEILVEQTPEDRDAHRRLVTLYRAQNLVHEHNLEVRRWKALREAREP
ncbi:MAG: tetratricopeptide repeat protein [Methanomassiliicoccus sp.]|nr:tetratricopeptide repeat protein [Methanomassiliicoccus sp.]